MELALELACVVVGAALQGITGFGFALFAAPLLSALAGPQAAVSELAVLGLLLNVGVLARRERQVDAIEVRRLLVWALPAMVVGVVLLDVLPRDPILALVGLSAIGGAAFVARGQDGPVPARPRGRAGTGPVVAGGMAGALTTLTGTNGPPLVVYLLARGCPPTVFRDTLAALFVALDGGAIVVLIAGGQWDTGLELLALIAAAGAGLAAGRGLHDRLSGAGFRRLTLSLLMVSGLVALGHAAL